MAKKVNKPSAIKHNHRGFITEIVIMLIVLIAAFAFVYIRVKNAQ